MGTLDELIYYCKRENPIGAMALYGESGSGKTFLVDQSLREALQDTHFIVRVSLFGISSIEALHTAVKKQWLYTCRPLLSKMKKRDKKIDSKKGLFKIAYSFLLLLNPQAQSIQDAVMNPLEYVTVTPEPDVPPGTEKKRVILVFDDVERSKLDWNELIGTINDYCENQHFNTILISNMEYLDIKDPEMIRVIRMAKEKTVGYTVLYYPDYEGILCSVINSTQWPSEAYGAFLKEHERTVLDVFVTASPAQNASLSKHHNIRSLITALETFYRIYYHMTNAGIRDIEPAFCSFIAYYLASKSGITKDGSPCYDPTDEEITQLYPRFTPGALPESVRHWIRFGFWDKALFEEELAALS